METTNRTNFTRRSIFAAEILVLVCAPNLISAEDWPFYRGPNRNGVATHLKLDPLAEPKQLWKAEVGPGQGSAVIASGKLYVLGREARVRNMHCLDATTGKPIWVTPLISHFSDSTPAVADGKVYAIGSTDEPHAYCLDAQSGQEIWKTALPKSSGVRHYGLAGSPVIVGELVIFNAGGGAALNRETGKVVWQFEGLPGLATPVLFNDRDRPAVAIFSGDQLVGRELKTGKELWTIPWKTKLAVNACDPVFLQKDSKVFVCSDYGLGRALYDLSTDPPRELWNFTKRGGGSAYSSGFALNGKLYPFAAGFCQLDLNDGSLVWDTGGRGSLLALGDKILFMNQSGQIQIGSVTDQGFNESMRAQIVEGQTSNVPAYWNGKLYVRNKAGTVHCVAISK